MAPAAAFISIIICIVSCFIRQVDLGSLFIFNFVRAVYRYREGDRLCVVGGIAAIVVDGLLSDIEGNQHDLIDGFANVANPIAKAIRLYPLRGDNSNAINISTFKGIHVFGRLMANAFNSKASDWLLARIFPVLNTVPPVS